MDDRRILIWSYWPSCKDKDEPPEFEADGLLITQMRTSRNNEFHNVGVNMHGSIMRHSPELMEALTDFNMNPSMTLELYWDDAGLERADDDPQWAIGLYLEFPNSEQAVVYRLFYRDWLSNL